MEAALYLIPVTLGNTSLSQVLPAYNATIVCQIRHFVVENVRSARRFLRSIDRDFPIDDCVFFEMGKHADERLFSQYLQPLRDGLPVGVISEAGCPAIADPGADVVAIAQRKNIKVVPLVGPSSIIMSVMGSGFNGQSFAFHGYLPIDDDKKTARIKQLESRMYAEDQTQLFIETPYRNGKMMQTLLSTLRPQTRICLAANITCADEKIVSRTVSEWRKRIPQNAADDVIAREIPRVPAIFLIYK